MTILSILPIKPIKDYQMRHHMWCNPKVIHRKSDPEFDKSLVPDTLFEAIHQSVVGHLSGLGIDLL